MVSLTVQFLPRAAVAFPAGPADGRASSFRDPVAVRAGLRRGRVRHGGARGGRETLGRDQEEGRGGHSSPTEQKNPGGRHAQI